MLLCANTLNIIYIGSYPHWYTEIGWTCVYCMFILTDTQCSRLLLALVIYYPVWNITSYYPVGTLKYFQNIFWLLIVWSWQSLMQTWVIVTLIYTILLTYKYIVGPQMIDWLPSHWLLQVDLCTLYGHTYLYLCTIVLMDWLSSHCLSRVALYTLYVYTYLCLYTLKYFWNICWLKYFLLELFDHGRAWYKHGLLLHQGSW